MLMTCPHAVGVSAPSVVFTTGLPGAVCAVLRWPPLRLYVCQPWYERATPAERAAVFAPYRGQVAEGVYVWGWAPAGQRTALGALETVGEAWWERLIAGGDGSAFS
jgi:hypothetical protein